MKIHHLVLPLLFCGLTTSYALESLRGTADLDEVNTNITPYQIIEGETPKKNYRQQPPLIPHKIEKYQINLKTNQCLRCHDWPYNTDFKAPKVSETHYSTRDGKPTDKVAAERWFCTQCHVPQQNTHELIENNFKPVE